MFFAKCLYLIVFGLIGFIVLETVRPHVFFMPFEAYQMHRTLFASLEFTSSAPSLWFTTFPWWLYCLHDVNEVTFQAVYHQYSLGMNLYYHNGFPERCRVCKNYYKCICMYFACFCYRLLTTQYVYLFYSLFILVIK